MGKRLQGRTKDKRKQGNFVSHVILSLRHIFSHIPPTVDVSLVSSAFVLSRVTAKTQRSGEKAKRAMQTAQYHQGTVGTTLVSLKAVNRRQDVFQLWSVFRQYKSFCLPNPGLFCFFVFFVFTSPFFLVLIGWAYTTVFLYESFKAHWRDAKCFPASSQ